MIRRIIIKRISIMLLIVSICMVLSFSGCKAEVGVKSELQQSKEDRQGEEGIEGEAGEEKAIYMDTSVPVGKRVENLLSLMTLEEKIGQMTQVARDFIISDEHITSYGIGSILSGGGSAPQPNTPENWADMYDNYQQFALSSRLGIPIIYGTDAVHGHNNLSGATIFPHNIGLGAAGDAELVKRVARITAIEASATGMDWTFSPCIAVPQDERWGRTYEGFSENSELVTALGKAAVEGYQGNSLSDDTSILACAKHFAGDGGTTGGIDRGNTECSEEDFRNVHITPYIGAIEAGVGSIMVSFNSWNGVPVHANSYLITDVLKGELGFDGLVVSDWSGINGIDGFYENMTEQDIMEGINAGIDMVMVPDNYVDFIVTLTGLVKDGRVSMERIDDAVRRILTIKFNLGLFENPCADRSNVGLIGSKEHREIAREAVRKSLVLLKNENQVLPLSKNIKRIVVAGTKADDIGSQCGGWTITWQGEVGDITEGTTILEAIESIVSEETEVIYSKDGSDVPEGAEVAIVVAGETPYAEYMGDDSDLLLGEVDANAINNLAGRGIPVVVILITGRPIIITDHLDKIDTLIAAWLPGTEGQGITDVIFGDYAPAGKLSYTWPASIDQIPINDVDGSKGALFPYGYGLTY
ncbi:MAG: glycoside hydrolase family 3 N-terminal domain-containing protein [Actinomycetota bacterium]|nr:glycoside hydrolase family 3 N-terminal domain-containing protein [Actinomycetota bacterium]